MSELTITDPVWEQPEKPSLFTRIFLPLVKDERDLPFIKLSFRQLLLLVPLAVYLFLPGNFSWWLAGLYWLLALAYSLGPFILMLHNTSHRTLFKYKPFNKIIPWLIGPWVGQSPETYYAHHMGLHHMEGNLPADLSSTMKYQRDSFFSFMHYFWVFFLFGQFTLSKYLYKKKRFSMLRRFWAGELFYIGGTVALMFYNWQAAFTVFAFPMFFTRFMLMAGNWGQHAFVDPEEPDNDHKSVITFINSSYNHKCFNDGYHIGHHVKASRHWLDMPIDFLDTKDVYIKNDALIFRKLDYFMIWLLLMLKRYKFLAKFYVQLDENNIKSEKEIIELFHRRLKRFDKEALAKWA